MCTDDLPLRCQADEHQHRTPSTGGHRTSIRCASFVLAPRVVRRRAGPSFKEIAAAVQRQDRLRGIAQVGSAACPTAWRRESSHARGPGAARSGVIQMSPKSDRERRRGAEAKQSCVPSPAHPR